MIAAWVVVTYSNGGGIGDKARGHIDRGNKCGVRLRGPVNECDGFDDLHNLTACDEIGTRVTPFGAVFAAGTSR